MISKKEESFNLPAILPEAELFSLGSDAVCLPDFIIQIDDKVLDEFSFGLRSELFPRNLHDFSEMSP
jgi:hypothetical protein